MADSKRYNLPFTQKCFPDQNKNLKQKDIRNMFQSALSNDDFAPLTQGIQKSTQVEPEILSINDCDILNDLFTEITSYLYVHETFKNDCKICNNSCKCITELIPHEKIDLNNYVIPNAAILGNIKIEDLNSFVQSSNTNSEINSQNKSDTNNINNSPFEFDTDLEIAFNDTTFERSSYIAPKNLSQILKKCNSPINVVETKKSIEEKSISNIQDDLKTLSEFFKLENFEDIFQDNKEIHISSPIQSDNTIIYDYERNVNDSPIKNPNSSSDIKFIKSPVLPNKIMIHSSKNTSTPSKYNNEIHSDGSESPILCTYQRTKALKQKAKRTRSRLNSEANNSSVLQEKINDTDSFFQISPENSNSFNDKYIKRGIEKKQPECSERLMTSKRDKHTQNVQTNNNSSSKLSQKSVLADVEDFFDLSSFLTDNKSSTEACSNIDKTAFSNEVKEKVNTSHETLNIEDFCDLSHFGVTPTQTIQERIGVLETNKISKKQICSSDSEDMFESSPQDKIIKSLPISHTKNVEKQQIDDINIISSDSEDMFPKAGQKDILNQTSSQISITQMLSLINTQNHVQKNKNHSLSKNFTVKKQRTVKKKVQNNLTQISLKSMLSQNTEKANKNGVFISNYSCKNNKENLATIQISSDDSSDFEIENNGKAKLFNKNKTEIKKVSSNSEKLTGNKVYPKLTNLSVSKTNKNESHSDAGFVTNNKVMSSKTKENVYNQSKVDISSCFNSEDEFEDTLNVSNINITNKKTGNVEQKLRKKQKLQVYNEFIEEEAEVSDDEHNVSIDESSGEDLDAYDPSFVADETVINNTQVYLGYLKTIKSPVRGTFKIPTRPMLNINNIYSQAVDNENDTYVQDSFCVNTEDILNEESEDENDLSELDLLELKLKEMRKNKKRRKKELPSKRKRIRVIRDDDSDSS